ncbi:MAG TPA: TetR/AcrR family transcriptional regulator C-terminal domain-containing protein [Trebonia sp.]|nr:TetR/AcrR family transcriptional regulator C-terminal domain-containing protein [Trebonia sp.]
MTSGNDGQRSGQGQAADAALPVWSRDKPKRRPALSRDAIVAAAIRIADAEGLEAVSIRRVTTDLGVRPMSLYTYIDRKEDLLVLMRDEVDGEVLIGADLPPGWREAITAISRRTREVVLRHPWMTDLAAHTASFGPNGLRHVEESITALRELHLDPPATIAVITAVDKYVMGHIAFEVANHSIAAASIAEQEFFRVLLATGEFPQLARFAADAVVSTGTEDQFERGLSWLLDGIAADISS